MCACEEWGAGKADAQLLIERRKAVVATAAFFVLNVGLVRDLLAREEELDLPQNNKKFKKIMA